MIKGGYMSGSTILKITGGVVAAIASIIGIEVGWNVIKKDIIITSRSEDNYRYFKFLFLFHK